jgi:pyruvate dehydrogenase E2 component (dihydrolipoamide acetyltransferase)
MADVAMPRLSDSMEEGTILKWLKSDGDEVKKGEELVEIETDKANMTYEADTDGVLSIVAQEGDTLPVGETIARIGDAAETGRDEGKQPTAEEEEEEAAQPAAEEEEEEAAQPAEQEEEEAAQPAAEEEAERPAAEGEEEEPSGNGKPTEKPAPAPAEAKAPSGNGDGDGRVKASPVAKRMAREMGVSLEGLEGTGPGGRIVKADVEAAARGRGEAGEASAGGEAAGRDREPRRREAVATAEAEAPAKPEEKVRAAEEKREVPPPVTPQDGDGKAGKGEVTHQELTRLQKTVARRMAESKATAPDFVITVEVDMEEAVELRTQLKAAAGDDPAPSFNDFVVKAAARALRAFPRANGAYRDGKFELYGRVNVGVAVAGQDALVVPTIFDADTKSLGTIAREARTVAERVRAGAITPPELSSGTFTVSNLGMYGIKHFVAVINPPQAAILAVGALEPRPVVRDGEITVRHMLELTLSCDHRILYGADAAEFLGRIREYLEQPLKLAL